MSFDPIETLAAGIVCMLIGVAVGVILGQSRRDRQWRDGLAKTQAAYSADELEGDHRYGVRRKKRRTLDDID